MTARQKQRLYWVMGLLGLGTCITGLVLFALRQNLNLFYTPEQVALGKAPAQQRIRVGGMVAKGSLKHLAGLQIQFTLTDFVETLAIAYTGILPDLFREGQGVVVLGKLGANQTLIADQILAKHDENYMPPEIVATLAQVPSNKH